MQTSTQMLGVLADEEGVVLKAYRCPAGVPTIGVGHTSSAGAPKVTMGMTVTREQAFTILANDLQKTFEPRVRKALPAVAQNVFDGAVSFDFNTGAIAKASWVGKFKAGAWAAAETAFKSWNKGGGKVLKGLVARRGREADIIFRNRYPKGAASPTATPAEPPAISATPEQLRPIWEQLHTLGYMPFGPGADRFVIMAWQRKSGLKPDGVVGKDSLAPRVSVFQTDNKLNVDGRVGPATRAMLIRRINDRTAKVAGAASTAGGGVGATGVELASQPAAVVDPAVVDPSAAADPMVATIILIALGVGFAVWLGLKLWSYRGLVTGRRVPT